MGVRSSEGLPRSSVTSSPAWWLGAGVFALAVAVFLPASQFEFVNWDDEANFISNSDYQGLGWENFRWFFTSTYMGHYQPLNWLTAAVDYTLAGGVDAETYHRTQVIFHGVATVCVFLLAARILTIGSPDRDRRTTSFSAAAAALVFSLHPLRAESVVWVSARTDILATIFFTLSAWSYLGRAAALRGSALSSRAMLTTIACFVLALLCKEMAVTLPAVLLILDVYPLRRLPADPRRWVMPEARRVIGEKWPLYLLALAASANALRAAKLMAIATFSDHPISSRLAQLPVSFSFYLGKTICPTRLSPLYEFPLEFGPLDPLVVAGTTCLAVIVVCLIIARRFAPGMIAAASCYVLMVLPVAGLTQRGPQMVADRYSYLSCVPFAICLGWCFARAARRRPWVATIATMVLLALMINATRRQAYRWRDSLTLWEYAYGLDATSGGAAANLGHACDWQRDPERALEYYKLGVRYGWRTPNLYRSLAGLCNRMNRHDEAIENYRIYLDAFPDNVEVLYFLGQSYEKVSDLKRAAESYRRAAELQVDFAAAHVALARLFVTHGFFAEAEPRLRHALKHAPDNTEAMEILAIVCAGTGRYHEAIALIDGCIEIVGKQGFSDTLADLRQTRARYAAEREAEP